MHGARCRFSSEAAVVQECFDEGLSESPAFAPWSPDRHAKGLLLPSSSVITWLIDEDGNPTHDQGAAVRDVDLVECVPLTIDTQGRVDVAFAAREVADAELDTALRRYDARLWRDESDGWRFD